SYDPCSVNEVLVSWCNYDEILEEWIPGIHVTPDFGGSCLSWLLVLTNTSDTNEQYFYQASSFDEFGDGITVILEDILLNDCTVWDLEIQTTGFLENYTIIASECGAVIGCTDSEALNFNALAICDDGSCTYAPCNAEMLSDWICEYDTELNEITQGFEIELTWNGVCSFTDLHIVSAGGTVDEWIDLSVVEIESGVPWLLEFEAPVASQYSLSAYTAGLSAVSLVEVTLCIAGCTDPEAENYDASALFDDGSCEYAACILNEVTFTLFLQYFADELGWNLLDSENQWMAGGSGYSDNSTWSDIWCLEDGCYTLELSDSFNDGWNGSYYIIQDSDGQVIRTGSIETGGTDLDVISLNADCPADGCTDPAAINYAPFATIEDGSCQYSTSEPLPEGEDGEIEISYNAGVSAELEVLLGGLEQGIVYQAQIYNSQGNLMSEQHFTAETATGSLSLDTSRLAAGVYYFVIHTDHQLSARQFIKL
ncbi:MAG: T9SS type A sorting domain-containing protein, partial [Flavobacteriales bacterium]|nr:T9SS type A sorting domain-containing protein [Flavobacteriales bacterium]